MRRTTSSTARRVAGTARASVPWASTVLSSRSASMLLGHSHVTLSYAHIRDQETGDAAARMGEDISKMLGVRPSE